MRYLLSPSEEKIAHDMLTTSSNSCVRLSLSSEDRSKIITLFSKAIKQVLNIPKYKSLPWWGDNSQEKIDQAICDELFRSMGVFLKYYLYHEKEIKVDRSLESPYRRYRTPNTMYFYEIRALNRTDEEAILWFKRVLANVLGKSYPEFYSYDKSPLTLMCINKFHKNSLFGWLPRDAARIIAKQVKEVNQLEIEGPIFRK